MTDTSAVLLALILNNKFRDTLNVVAMVDKIKDNWESVDESEIQILQLMSQITKDKPFRTKSFVERVVNNYTRLEFQQNFRVQIETYEFLLCDVTRLYHQQFPSLSGIAIDKQLLAVIWILGNKESYRSIGDRFDMAKSSLSWCFFRIVKIFNMLAPSVIKWPDALESERIKLAFFTKTKIQGVIGAIDGTYCPISVPVGDSHAYTNRKKFTSITLQAICNDNMMFTDCFVGYPSSVHDARIFRNSPIFERANRSTDTFFPDDTKILGDKAYPLLKWCITPYKDFGTMTCKQKHFNYIHCSTRQIIERCFALFFGRFRRFQHLEMKNLKDMPDTILAACVLHNICLKFPEEVQTTEQYVQTGANDVQSNEAEYLRSNTGVSAEGKREREKMADELWSQRAPQL